MCCCKTIILGYELTGKVESSDDELNMGYIRSIKAAAIGAANDEFCFNVHWTLAQL